MSDPAELLGSRVESFRYELLDAADQVVRELVVTDPDRGVVGEVLPGGTIDIAETAEVIGSGSITMIPASPINWLNARIRVSYIGAGRVEPVLTALPRVPGQSMSPVGDTVSVSLLDKTSIPKADSYGEQFSVAAGVSPIDAATAVLASSGANNYLLDATTATLSAGMVWDAGTSKLKIVNDLLAAANYDPLIATPAGVLRGKAYTNPTARGVAWEFADTTQGVYLPTWTRPRDLSTVPNKLACIGRIPEGAAEGTVALVATATDTRTDSPFSYANRGNRWITAAPVQDVDYDGTLGTLQAIANRKLTDAQQVATEYEITHPWLPFGLRDVVTFANVRRGYTRALAVCTRQTIRLQPGGLITSTLKEVL